MQIKQKQQLKFFMLEKLKVSNLKELTIYNNKILNSMNYVINSSGVNGLFYCSTQDQRAY
jgi:hypothetical protein